MGIVYLICDPASDLFKIGVTRGSIEKRIKQLQVGNGSEIFIRDFYECEYPFRLETILHNKFKYLKQSGEWFALKAEHIINFKDICKEIDNTIHLLKDNEFFIGKGLK